MFARLKSRWFILICASACAAASWLGARPVAAAEIDKLDSAVKLVPADAAFFGSMMRNREQFDAIRRSNAWAKIQEMPVVKMGLSIYNMQLAVPNSGPAQLQTAMQNPEVRKLVDLASDMVSDEVFVYGDQDFVSLVDLMQNVSNAMRYGPAVAQAAGQAEELTPNQLQTRAAISALIENEDLIVVPSLIVGFKLKNVKLAEEELIKLETIANLMLEANEKTKGRFKKTKVGDADFLVLELSGDLVPWNELPMDKLEEIEAEKGQARKIVDQLKELELTLAVGLRGNYLVVSIGPSLDGLENLGEGDRLVDRPELQPLAKFADKRLASIVYLSEAMNRQLNDRAKTLEQLREMADEALPAAELSKSQNERIRNDADKLVEDLKGMIPALGARMGLCYLTDRGVESWQYAWGDHKPLDGSKPLGLLEHVGGDPLFGAVVRVKIDVDNYDLIVKWVKVGYGYFEEFGLPNMPEEDREKLKQFLAAATPLFERLDKVNREMTIPALADGQLGLVVDAKLSSKQFYEAMPAVETDMPMLEPALVRGVSDAKLLKQSFGEYREIANGLIDAMRNVEGTDVPEGFEIPAPVVTESSVGTFYSFPLPKEWGVDEQIVPNLALSDSVLVVSASHAHGERLLKSTPLAAGGLLAQVDRPLAAAVWLNWSMLVQTAEPWVDYALKQSAEQKGLDETQQKMIGDQVRVGLEVLQAIRVITSEAYFEDGALVGHTLTEIRDVEK